MGIRAAGAGSEDFLESSVRLRGIARTDTVDSVADEHLKAATETRQGADLADFERTVRATYDERLPRFLKDLVQ